MELRFSGSFKRLTAVEAGEVRSDGSGYELSAEQKLRVAEMDLAALELKDKILNEVDDRYQLTYNPHRGQETISIRERTGETFVYIRDHDEDDKDIKTSIRSGKKEPAKAFIQRAIDFSKELHLRLTTLREQRNRLEAALETVSGWILPQVTIGQDVARGLGLEKARKLKELLQKMAPDLEKLPDGIALHLRSRYDNNKALRLAVVKKGPDGAITDFTPTRQYSDENDLEQSVYVKFGGFWFIPKILRMEDSEKFIRRGIAHAVKMIQLEKDVVLFESALEKALSKSHGNFAMEKEVVGKRGIEHALTVINTLQSVSEALHKIGPDLRLEYHSDWEGREVLSIERQTNYGSYYGIFYNEGGDEYNKGYVYRRLGGKLTESFEAFVNRTVELAAEYITEIKRREAIRSQLDAGPDQGLVIEKTPPAKKTPETGKT